jgi:GNAT superfamily N-acetyltransferase
MKFKLEKVDYFNRLNCENKGYIDFRIVDDLLIWDCYTYKEYRNQGVFKILLDELNKRYPDKIFCAAVANKKLIPYLEKMGYEKTMDGLPYWGRPSNCKIMKKAKKID